MSKRKTVSRSELARELIKAGKLSPAEIAKRTGLSSQTIYTLKWKVAKKQGLGAIKPKTTPVGKGTGIAASVPRAAVPLEFEIIDRPKAKKQSNNRRNAQLKRWARERAERERRDFLNQNPLRTAMKITYASPQPSLWQRIKGFFGV